MTPECPGAFYDSQEVSRHRNIQAVERSVQINKYLRVQICVKS